MLSIVQITGYSVHGQRYERPQDSPQPELEQWRETMDAGDAQVIDVPSTALTSFGQPWQEVVSRQRARDRLRQSPDYSPPSSTPRGVARGK
eukprot:9132031-Alexandrium_andersonii.AAC.1